MRTKMNYLYIALGSILGASGRHFIFTIMEQKSLNFPWHTLVVNLTGCILIGFIAELFSLKSNLPYNIRLFLVTGFLGSFTTFSTFALDCGLLIGKNELLKSAAYILGSVLLGIIGYLLACWLTRYIFAPKI